VYALKIGGGIVVVDETQLDGRASRLASMAWAVSAAAAAVRSSLAALTAVAPNVRSTKKRSRPFYGCTDGTSTYAEEGLIGQGFHPCLSHPKLASIQHNVLFSM